MKVDSLTYRFFHVSRVLESAFGAAHQQAISNFELIKVLTHDALGIDLNDEIDGALLCHVRDWSVCPFNWFAAVFWLHLEDQVLTDW